MPTSPDVKVTFEGEDYMVPADIVAANARQPGLAKAWIEDQLAAKAERQAAAKAQREDSIEREFVAVKGKLAKFDAFEERLQQQADAIEAYRSANAAQQAKIEALEAADSGLGSTSSKAREASLELSQQVVGSALMLETMARREEALTATLASMEQRLALLESQQKQQITDHLAAGQTRQRLEQEATNKLLDDVGRAEERAAKAEGAANQALSTAEGARLMNRDQFTQADVLAIVQQEIRLSAEQIVEMVIAQLRPEFPQGFAGQRMDPGYIDQTTRDRVNSSEIRVGLDEAVKQILRNSGSA